jgi:1,4-dihydroxy-6-naphthoate synthase
VAVPGVHTSAFAAASLMLGPGSFPFSVVPFDDIVQQVAAGEYEAGLVIHEGQLTYVEAGLRLIVDLGAWWHQQHGLPLPLGGNVIQRDLENRFGPGALGEIASYLRQSVEYALQHREESLEYAAGFARGTDAALTDEFVDMYVNTWTLDFGPVGREALSRFLGALQEAGLAPDAGPIDFVRAAR